MTRPDGAPAFLDTWALGLLAAAGSAAALASGVWRDRGEPEAARFRILLWIAAGSLLLFGVTGQLARLFQQRPRPAAAAGPGSDMPGPTAAAGLEPTQ